MLNCICFNTTIYRLFIPGKGKLIKSSIIYYFQSMTNIHGKLLQVAQQRSIRLKRQGLKGCENMPPTKNVSPYPRNGPTTKAEEIFWVRWEYCRCHMNIPLTTNLWYLSARFELFSWLESRENRKWSSGSAGARRFGRCTNMPPTTNLCTLIYQVDTNMPPTKNLPGRMCFRMENWEIIIN